MTKKEPGIARQKQFETVLSREIRRATMGDTKGPGGFANLPNVIPSAKKEDIQRIGMSLLRWYTKEPARTDEEISERLEEFFRVSMENGEMMTWEKLCLALGYTRSTIGKWERGEEGSTPTRRALIKKARELMAAFEGEMSAEGKINPVVYIFRAKNYFGMVDKQEHVIAPSNPLGEHADPEEIRKRLSDGVIDVEGTTMGDEKT